MITTLSNLGNIKWERVAILMESGKQKIRGLWERSTESVESSATDHGFNQLILGGGLEVHGFCLQCKQITSILEDVFFV